ncbi:MAG: hypothetical protein ACI9NQ_000143 [Paracoccaceae bacterium]|jgi:hypothetical protein
MSTITEIETAIEKLAPDEFAELAAWINARQSQELETPDFEKSMDKVFGHHAPLLEKLSQ